MKTTDVVLLLISVICLTAVIVRTDAIKLDRGFMLETLPLALVAIGLIAFTMYSGTFQAGVHATGKITVKMLPMMVCFFIIMGFANIIISQHKDVMIEAINGKHGPLNALWVSILMPSMVALPAIKQFWSEGANVVVIMTFLLAMRLMSWPILLIQLPFLGNTLSAIYVGCALGTSLIITAGAYVWSWSRI